jgi:hypothetical protein
MPEAFAVLFVFVVAIASYIAARIQTANPSQAEIALDFQRLRQHRAWLEERRQQALAEKWDAAMLARLEEEIALVDCTLAREAAEPGDAA